MTLSFYLTLVAILSAVGAGVYFLLHWRLNKRHDFSLLWGLGFIFIYLFQIPRLLSNAGLRFVLSDAGLFIGFSLTVAFLGWILIYFGLRMVRRNGLDRKRIYFLALWVVIHQVFHLWLFLSGGVSGIYAGLPYNVFLFIIPIHVLIGVELWRCRRYAKAHHDVPDVKGAFGMSLALSGVIFGVAHLILAVVRTSSYSSALAFFGLGQDNLWLALQTVTILMLTAGFVLMHEVCCEALSAERDS